jgi:HSP20 family protein
MLSRLGGFGGGGLGSTMGSSQMTMNLCECPDCYCLKVDVPGYEKDEVKLSLNGSLLTIATEPKDTGEKREKEGEAKTLFRERECGNCIRSLRLPADVDFDKISAQHHLGQLIVNIKKNPEKSRSVMIE